MTADPGGRPSVTAVVMVGIGAGFLGGLFGVGGGLLIVPALVLVLGFDQRLAHGTSLAAILPIAVASLVTYWSAGNVDWAAALWISVGAVVGAVLGTRLLHVIPKRALTIAFVAVMLATAVRLFIATDAAGRDAVTLGSAFGLSAVGLVAGTLAGLLGVGGGIVMVPAMVVLFGITPVVAKGTSVAVIVPTALMGTWRNRRSTNVDLRVASILGAAGILAAVAGGLISDRMSDEVSNALFAVLLLLVSYRQLRSLPPKETSVAGDLASQPGMSP